jgi:hypothetical protein
MGKELEQAFSKEDIWMTSRYIYIYKDASNHYQKSENQNW